MARSSARRTHLEITREAGLPRISPISILAGLVTAYGSFAILASIAGAIANAADADTEFRTNDWTGSGVVTALISALVLLVAYLFGGYVAGRMARRAGILHGLLVAIAGLVVGAVVGAVVSAIADNADVKRNLRSIGVPTTSDQVSRVAIAAAIVSLVAMLAGGALGGLLGERWHTKLAKRAADDAYGPAAEARARAEREERERQRRVEADPVVSREAAADRPGDGGDDTGAGGAATADAVPVAHQDHGDRGTGGGDDEPRYTLEEWRQLQARQRST